MSLSSKKSDQHSSSHSVGVREDVDANANGKY